MGTIIDVFPPTDHPARKGIWVLATIIISLTNVQITVIVAIAETRDIEMATLVALRGAIPEVVAIVSTDTAMGVFTAKILMAKVAPITNNRETMVVEPREAMVLPTNDIDR